MGQLWPTDQPQPFCTISLTETKPPAFVCVPSTATFLLQWQSSDMVWLQSLNIHYLALSEGLQTPSLEQWFPKCGPCSETSAFPEAL